MVMLIEDQIHRHFKDLEEERCLKREAELALVPEARGRKVKRKAIPKPWTRLGPRALCQEPELLELVRDYDYDLADEPFRAYCASRGVLHFTGDVGGRRWAFFLHHRKTRDEYLQDPCFQSAQEWQEQRYRYTAEEMETGWRAVALGRAMLQDCWELHVR